MSVDRFLEDLKFLLSDLPEEEREEALDFYRCYFEDAGEENLDAVIAELGSPEKVAYTIREGLKDKEDEGEFTETGYRTYDDISAPATRDAHKENAKRKNKTARTENKAKAGACASKAEGSSDNRQPRSRKRRNPVAAFFLAILKILMTIAAVCIVILLICAFVALLIVDIASIVATVALLITGIGMLVSGMGLVGVAMIGLTFISFAVFILLLMAFVAFCKKGLAGGIRGITSLTGNFVHERRRKEA